MLNRTEGKLVLVLCAIAVMLWIGMATATADVKTTKLSGTVVSVDGPNLLVKMSTGEVKLFTPPPDRKFMIDGKDLTLSELQPGTHLEATMTETTTTATERKVESIEGTVWYAKAPTVVLILSSGEAHKYIVKHDDPVTITDQNGKPITAFDLKKGMKIKASKITEAPIDTLLTTTTVTGTAPKMAEAPAASTAEPAAAPAAAATPPTAHHAKPKMPKTGSPLPLIGELGLLFIILAFGIRRILA